MSKPKTIEAPVTVEAEADAMAQFNALRDVLAQTHTRIPALLDRERKIAHELGLAEAQGENADDLRKRLAATEAERASAVRRRGAAIASILELEPRLQAEGARVERERQRVGVAAMSAFRMRFDSAVSALQALMREGDELSRMLRVSIPMAMPTRPSVNAAGEAPLKDIEVESLSKRLDELDEALSRCGGIRQSKLFDQREYALAEQRRSGTDSGAVFVVKIAFQCPLDGEMFEPGMLIDKSLIGAGMIGRLQSGRKFIWPSELETGANAA